LKYKDHSFKSHVS